MHAFVSRLCEWDDHTMTRAMAGSLPHAFLGVLLLLNLAFTDAHGTQAHLQLLLATSGSFPLLPNPPSLEPSLTSWQRTSS